ncbi:MAG: hypothetical protein M1821_002450 [Bathelium mastoideum]|nr:MAG: hypothetical protein M1821_002450 [Bathelium mastoideum]
MTQLERTKTIIDQVEKLRFASKTSTAQIPSIVNAISGQAAACRDVLKKFVAKVERYDPSLGAQAPQGAHRGLWTKTKWAVYFSKELRSIQNVITAHVEGINLLFQVLVVCLSADIREQQAINDSRIESSYTTLSDAIKTNASEYLRQVSSQQSSLQNLSEQMAQQTQHQLTYSKILDDHLDASFAGIKTHVTDIVLGQKQGSDSEIATMTQAVNSLRNDILSLKNAVKEDTARELGTMEVSREAVVISDLVKRRANNDATVPEQPSSAVLEQLCTYAVPFIQGLQNLFKLTTRALEYNGYRQNEVKLLYQKLSAYGVCLRL